MRNLITKSNFDSKKVEILNSVSTFGSINNPNTWYIGLSVFEFENELVEELVTTLLTNKLFEQMSKIYAKNN